MARIEHQYVKLLHDIMKNGVVKEDRTGTGTISVFGRQVRHDMSEGFPLLTTKKMYWKGIVSELLWFLRGETNIKWLVENNNNIWVGDAYKFYLEHYVDEYNEEIEKKNEGLGWMAQELVNIRPLSKEQFIEKIKKDDEFVNKWGELGPIYGKQWRSWNSYESNTKVDGVYDVAVIDQISNLIEQLKTNPDSRRLMVNAWNVGDLDKMTLPPCHYGFQVYTRKLSESERFNWYGNKKGSYMHHDHIEQEMDENNVPKRTISLMWNQRSVDTFLGLPFNIASYALLLKIIAKEVNMIPDELIGNLGDVHLYKNHIEQAKEQMTRDINHEPELVFKDAFWDLCDGNIPLSDKINEYKPEWFTIENYMPHPPIKAPLSN